VGRITLAPFSYADADELLGVFRHPDVRRFLLDDEIVSSEWLRDEIEASDARFACGSAGLWTVRLTGAPGIIGFTGFRDFFDPPQLQLLYGLLPQYWKRGLALEAAARACDYAIHNLGFTVINAATDLPNDASIRVLERLGMTRTRVSDAGPAGTAFFALTRAAWLERADGRSS
jgi:[ribosomal protein S5]-alanine N-acetyltransferase